MERIMEPEPVMMGKHATSYAEADFSTPHDFFVDFLLKKYSSEIEKCQKAIDLGCGPGDLPIRLVKKIPRLNVLGIDASEDMLEYARNAVVGQNLGNRISFLKSYIPPIPLRGKYDLILSNSFIHHLSNLDAKELWNEIKRLGRKRSIVYVGDLRRPENEREILDLVKKYATQGTEILSDDFRHSLEAAFTVKEIKSMINSANLSNLSVESVGDRHWIVHGYL